MKQLLLLASFFIYGLSFAQPSSKMDFYLTLKSEAYAAKKIDANVTLPMLVQGKTEGIKELVSSCGGIFKYSYGNIAAVVIPVSALSAFNKSSSVRRMEGTPPRMRLCDDSSNVKNFIKQVLAGQVPLPQAYDGKGIVMGFVDSGIDYLHPDFRDSSGTRVKYYWDMNRYTNGYTPNPYGYGQSWTKAQIDASLGTDPNDSASILEFGHGSNVAGAACGNSKCDGYQIGGCPKADIIMVAFNFNNQTPTMLTDAMQYIFTCADSLNEPCVVNLSLGDYDGSHDDSDLQGEMMDSMILAKQPGRFVVASAGNFGQPYHVHDSLKSGDTAFTWFLNDAGLGYADIPIFANEADFNNIKFKIRCDKVQTGSYIERDTITIYSSIANFLGHKTMDIYNSNGQRLGVLQSYEQVYGKASYSLEFEIIPDSTSYYWGFQATGTGRFDIWDYGTINGVVDSTSLAINPSAYPGIKHYKQPDSIQTICSSYQCSPYVMTAQTYFNRKTYVDCSNITESNPYIHDVPGAFVWGTSKGPTRNFAKMKPDISASGNYTLSALPTWLSSCYSGSDLDSCHDIDGGTSMASPMVASAAGLYLCKYPHAVDSNIKRCLIETAYSDAFTGSPSQLPNYNWGYGKLNAFNALTLCAPTDVPAISPPPVQFNLSAYPNPCLANTQINYDFSAIKNFSNAVIVIYDVTDKTIKTISLKENKGSITLNMANFASGMYFYSLMVDGFRLKTEKLEVL